MKFSIRIRVPSYCLRSFKFYDKILKRPSRYLSFARLRICKSQKFLLLNGYIEQTRVYLLLFKHALRSERKLFLPNSFSNFKPLAQKPGIIFISHTPSWLQPSGESRLHHTSFILHIRSIFLCFHKPQIYTQYKSNRSFMIITIVNSE